MTAFAVEVDREKVTRWLVLSGWLDEAEVEDLDAIEMALSMAVEAWVADPTRPPPEAAPVKGRR
jgi:hypothetical protein